MAANSSGVVSPVRDSTRELAIDALDAAGRDLEILAPDRVLDVLDGQAVGRQPVAVEPDAHGIAALAQDLDLGHAAHVLQPVARVAVDEVGDVQRGHAVAGEGEIEDRVGVGLDLADDRLVDLVGQAAAHARDPVAHVGGGVLRVGVEGEAGGDPAGFLPAGRGQHVDARDAGDRGLQHLGDLGLHDLGAGAGIAGDHRDHRLVDVRDIRAPAAGRRRRSRPGPGAGSRPVANTGRRMQSSGRLIELSSAPAGWTISTCAWSRRRTWPLTTTTASDGEALGDLDLPVAPHAGGDRRQQGLALLDPVDDGPALLQDHRGLGHQHRIRPLVELECRRARTGPAAGCGPGWARWPAAAPRGR